MRNPPELGIMESALRQVKNGKVYIIPVGLELLKRLVDLAEPP